MASSLLEQSQSHSGGDGSVVYAWDVVNEYMHATNCGWLSIYGNVNNNPSFVKKAFQYAHRQVRHKCSAGAFPKHEARIS